MKKSLNKLPKAENQQTDAEKASLLGSVKQVMQVCYKAHLRGGLIVRGKLENKYSHGRLNFIETYDKNGHRTEEELFGLDGRTVHLFNEKGLQTAIVNYSRDGNLTYKTDLIYSEKGNLLEFTMHDGDGNLMSYRVYKYREDGKPLEEMAYMGVDKKLHERLVHEYDGMGNNLSTIRYNADGSVNYSNVNKYNEQGKIVENISEHSDEKMAKHNRRMTFKYNDHGDVIESSYYNPDGSLNDTYYSTWEYDSDGKKIIPFHPPYDPNAKAAGETEECENDSHGNWVKKTTFFNKIPVNIFLREITYYDDASENNQPAFIHPLTMATDIEKTNEHTEELTTEQAQWLVDAPNASADNFSILRYYALLYKGIPSHVVYTGPHIEALVLLHELKENMEAEEIHSYSTIWSRQGEQMIRYTLKFPGQEYLLHAAHIVGHDEDEFEVPSNLRNSVEHFLNGNVYFSQLHLLRPSDASGKRDELFEEELDEYISKCSLTKKPDKPVINMIEVNQNGFVMREHAVNDDFEIKDLDVNYGQGFAKFHEELMHRFNTSTKGLVLFHGQPGTGKTYYIRHLLRKMAATKKVVIYIPPNMVDHLVDPSFMTFLAGEVQDWSNDGNFCVLLIEDAEPLLAKRQEGVRIQGVTNLLNMTDGLLNDMLNLQIICTFNVDLKKLDSALLRPGRLIARKEFKSLGELDANLLAQRLGIKHHFTSPATLGEIYAMRKNMQTLVHDVEPDKSASRPIDDF